MPAASARLGQTSMKLIFLLLSFSAAALAQQPSGHFYIHGTLNGDTAFQVLLPDPKLWKGRLLGEPPYALANGAAYVESSQGHRGPQVWRAEVLRY